MADIQWTPFIAGSLVVICTRCNFRHYRDYDPKTVFAFPLLPVLRELRQGVDGHRLHGCCQPLKPGDP